MHHARPRSRHLRLIVSVVTIILVLLAGTATWLTHSQRAFAATAPAYSHSWYITSIYNLGYDPTYCNWSLIGMGWTSDEFGLGCSDGQWDGANCTNSLVVLDFGQLDYQNGVWGTNYYTGPPTWYFMSTAQIQQAAEDYALGWYDATPSCPRLRLAIGTNNGGECPSDGYTCNLTTGGQVWKGVIANVNSWLVSNNLSWQISAAGADDMETEWDHYDRTTQFVDGFMSGGNNPWFYDYGDATPGYATCCGWTPQAIYHVAWGAATALPLPEIYYNCKQCEWTDVETQTGTMYMSGTMSECTQPLYNFATSLQTCSSPSGEWAPAASWTNMLNAQGTSRQSSMAYATNIRRYCWYGGLPC